MDKNLGLTKRQKFEIFMLSHILNPLWHSRLKRRQIRNGVYYKYVRKYLEKYIDFIKELPIEEVPVKKDGEPQGKIFSIWLQGEENAPKLVKRCFESFRKRYGDRFIVLDEKTLPNWIALPDYIEKKKAEGKIGAAHYSDICRVELLYQHGGYWFDATDYLTDDIPQWIEDSDFFLYREGEKITPTTFIQNCFMHARKGHPLFGAWRTLLHNYWKNEDKAVDYFFGHYLFRLLIENNADANKLFFAMPQINQDPTHVLWFKNRDKTYSEELYKESTKDAFFQKLCYKKKQAVNPRPGSVADYVVNGRIEIEP